MVITRAPDGGVYTDGTSVGVGIESTISIQVVSVAESSVVVPSDRNSLTVNHGIIPPATGTATSQMGIGDLIMSGFEDVIVGTAVARNLPGSIVAFTGKGRRVREGLWSLLRGAFVAGIWQAEAVL